MICQNLSDGAGCHYKVAMDHTTRILSQIESGDPLVAKRLLPLALKGKPHTDLHIDNSHVADLSPLEGMPQTILWCNSSQIASPLDDSTRSNCVSSQAAWI